MSSSEAIEKVFPRYIAEPPINSSIENFFAKYASIPPSSLRNHLIVNRERAWKHFSYPCLGQWAFLDFSIQQNPIYKEILQKCTNEGATVIDFGCCLGQDVRQLVYDGVPLEQIRGYELHPFYIEQGYELFQDGEIMKKKNVFSSGDIFDDEFLEKTEPADYLYAGLFIHLFDAEKQKDVCRRLTRLCKGVIAGRQAGSFVPVERPIHREGNSGKFMSHSPESFGRMWDEAINGEWQVESATLQTSASNEHVPEAIVFVVRKKPTE